MEILSFSEKIRLLREEKNLTLRKAAADLDIDQSLLSKYELGKRLPPQKFVRSLAEYFKIDERELLALFISEKIFHETEDKVTIELALKITQRRLQHT